ncbi:MAG: class I SAM-dependent methyltransferase [Gemmatimonadales bacterium]
MLPALTDTDPMDALKARLKTMWESGDYSHFAKYMEPGAGEFLERLGIAPGTRVLDVACGAGQFAIAAARGGADVTGIDLASNLIARAQSHASSTGLAVRFDEGDAEQLPYDDGEFDLVVSLIGAIFAPQPDRVAAELLRVCRAGGQIVMANWTPEGHIGQMFRILGAYLPLSPLMPSPMKWGDEPTLRWRLGRGTASLKVTRRMYPMHFPFPPNEVVEFFRENYGPVNRAFVSLDSIDQQDLRYDLEELWTRHNRASDGTTEVQAEYLEVVAVQG